MIVRDVIASTYILLNNVSEHELDYAVALEQFGSVINMMKYERVFGNLDNVIEKDTITFSDSTGVATNALSNFGDVVYLEFNNMVIEECTVAMLDLYYEQGIQRVAFWEDASAGTKYAELSIPETGTLKVWHEPDVAESNARTATVEAADSLKWCIATRLAERLINYITYEDPSKEVNKPLLRQSLSDQARQWKDIYLELVNRLGTNRPFSRLPFSATYTRD
jgi:hypothetical protein